MYDLSLLRSNESFRALWGAEAAETVATGLNAVALPWFVLALTGSPLQLALSFALRSAPDLVVSPVVGGLLDRHSRRRMMALGDAATAVLTAVLPILYLAGRLAVGHVYLVMLGLSVTRSLSHNAARAALPAVVEDRRLDEANALLMGVRDGGGVAFLLVGGALTVAVGPAAVLLAAAAGSLLAAAALLVAGPRLGRVDADGGLPAYLRDFRAGVRTLRSSPVLVQLLAYGVAYNLFVVPFGSVLLPSVARSRFGSAAALTALLVGWRGGSLVGNAVAGRVGAPARTKLVAGVAVVGAGTFAAGVAVGAGRVVPGGAVLETPGVAGLPAAVLAVAAPLFVAGVGQPLFDVTGSSLLQATAPDANRGTVVTVQNSLLQASFPVTLFLTGELLAVLSPGTLLALAGLALLLLSVAVLVTFDGPGR